MKKRIIVMVSAAMLCFSNTCMAQEESKNRLLALKDDIVADYKHFYSIKELTKLALGVGMSGILANTSADGDFRDWYRDEVRSSGTDDLSDAAEQIGDIVVVAPILIGASLLGEFTFTKDTALGSIIGEWGMRSARALLVGSPSMVFLQYALGSSRPSEGDSDWDPFHDNNSVSGHTFIGATPFIAAAQMSDNVYLKSLFYVASALPGASRINDDKHYLSQVILGWWLAYVAAESVEKTEEDKIVITPVVLRDGGGVRLTKRF